MRQGDELGDEQLGELRSVEYLQGLKGFSSDLLAILKMSELLVTSENSVVSPEDLPSHHHCPTLNLHPPKQNLVCFWKLNRIYYTITPTYFSLQIQRIEVKWLKQISFMVLTGRKYNKFKIV